MAARTLAQIVKELNSADAPIVKSIQQRQSLIPGQLAAEEQGLQAKQTQAFDTILGGARQRGLGFSGIPLAEQAKYTSTEFLPALARLKQTGREQEMTLQDAILNIRSGNTKMGQQLLQQERDRAEQRRQFNANLALQKQQAADARRAAGSSGAGLAALFGGGSSQPKIKAPKVDAARDEVVSVIGNRDYEQLQRYYNALKSSAGYGNPVDARKLEYLQALQPGLFKKGKLDTNRLNALINAQRGNTNASGGF